MQGNRAGSNEGAVRRAVGEGIHNSFLDWFVKIQGGIRKVHMIITLLFQLPIRWIYIFVLYGNEVGGGGFQLTNKEKRGKRGIKKSDQVCACMIKSKK